MEVVFKNLVNRNGKQITGDVPVTSKQNINEYVEKGNKMGQRFKQFFGEL